MSTFTKYPRSAKWIIGILFILNIFCLAALWFGRPKHKPHHQRHHQRLLHQIKKEIPFDEQQLATLDTMLARQQMDQRKIHDTIKQLKLELMNTMTSTDKKALFATEKLVDQIGNLTKKYEGNKVLHFEELKKLCTPEQREILIDIMIRAIKKSPLNKK